MLKTPPIFATPFGIGDMLMSLPSLQRLGKKICLRCSPYQIGAKGMLSLIGSLAPNITPLCRRGRPEIADWYEEIQDSSLPMFRKWANHYGIEPVMSFPKTVTDIIPKHGDGKFILIHPHTRSEGRQWNEWKYLDLSGVRYFVLGGENDPTLLPGTRIEPNYLTIAGYMLNSVGLLCVNSSMMNLANILGVRSITINTVHNGGIWPNLGEQMYQPSPRLVEKAIMNMWKRAEL